MKNVLIDSPEQTFARKFQEAALAIRVERKYSKNHILELYLNEAYYGNGAYGIETAAGDLLPHDREGASRSRRPPCSPV